MITEISRSVSQAAPELEPLTLAEAKKHLEIAVGDTAHDSQLSGLIAAAREIFEHDTGRLTTARAVTEKLNEFPDGDSYRDRANSGSYDGYRGYTNNVSSDHCWRFYYRPVASITSINYYDSTNATQLLATAVYTLDAPNRHLLLKPDQNWPSVYERWDAITIVYSAGSAKVPESVKSALYFKLDVLFELRGMTKEKDACERAYTALVDRFCRSTYP